MLDPFDYKEPSCPLSDGRRFYYPSPDDPKGTVPVRRIIEKLDAFYSKNDTAGAGEFLRLWEKEAKELLPFSLSTEILQKTIRLSSISAVLKVIKTVNTTKCSVKILKQKVEQARIGPNQKLKTR